MILAGTIVLGLFSINYIIDPWGMNNTVQMNINEVKFRDDERVAKFDLIKLHPDVSSFIFGTSRTTIIDPELIEKHTGERTLNISFSAGTITEIELYINWLLEHRKVTSVFLGLDLFSFSDEFVATGTLPEELQETPISNFSQYFSSDMFFFSLRTVKFNIQKGNSTNSDKEKYLAKGMRHYKEYFEIKNEEELKRYIEVKVDTPDPDWHANSYSKKKILSFTKMLDNLKAKQVKVHLFVNPLLIKQILKDSNYVTQLEMIKEILVNNRNINLYDFNNLNKVNKESKFYINELHYNYQVADCIIDEVLTFENKCSDDFGVNLNSENIDDYIARIKGEWFEIKQVK